jgi:glutathione S-transferase
MLKLHHLENSRSQRVLWLLEELGLDYELVLYKRDPRTMLAPPELKRVHPLGFSPVLEDGDRIVAESGAILEYLARKTGSFRPDPDSADGMACTHWLHYAEGSLMPLLLMGLVLGQLGGARVPFVVRPVGKALAKGVRASFLNPRLALHLGYVEDALLKRAWLAGDAPSIADVQMSFPLQAAASREGAGPYPAIVAWLACIAARPAWARALERGGPYAYV